MTACKICNLPRAQGNHDACVLALERKPRNTAQAFNRFIPPEIDDIAEDLRDIAEDIYIPVED